MLKINTRKNATNAPVPIHMRSQESGGASAVWPGASSHDDATTQTDRMASWRENPNIGFLAGGFAMKASHVAINSGEDKYSIWIQKSDHVSRRGNR